jgi:hypothetical protein
MLDTLGEGSEVHIVPIVFTSRGTPPPNWAELCAKMKFKYSNEIMLEKIQTIILTALDEIMSRWSKQSFAAAQRR